MKKTKSAAGRFIYFLKMDIPAEITWNYMYDCQVSCWSTDASVVPRILYWKRLGLLFLVIDSEAHLLICGLVDFFSKFEPLNIIFCVLLLILYLNQCFGSTLRLQSLNEILINEYYFFTL